MTKTEAQTRAELIDKQLEFAGWNVKDPTQVVEEFGIRTILPNGITKAHAHYDGHQFSDYVLLGKDRKPLAVVEAKKTNKDATNGREQAKQYCYNIQKQFGGELPFCFYSNGHDTYFWDLENYPPRKIIGFPTREDLERFQYIRRNKKQLTQEFINKDIAGRDYQIRAIRAVLESIDNKKRDFLLVMATGTGKTRTCIALTDSLMRAGYAERILFLVDRIALREQAFEHFIQEHSNLSTRQLEFLALLKDVIIEREKLEKKDLISSPFTVIHPQGIRGVFSPTEINEILQLTEQLVA